MYLAEENVSIDYYIGNNLAPYSPMALPRSTTSLEKKLNDKEAEA